MRPLPKGRIRRRAPVREVLRPRGPGPRGASGSGPGPRGRFGLRPLRGALLKSPHPKDRSLPFRQVTLEVVDELLLGMDAQLRVDALGVGAGRALGDEQLLLHDAQGAAL